MVGTTLWAFSGLLLGLGVVGFLTGLLLLPFSLLLMRYLRSKAVPNSWAAVVGAGLGGLLLLWNDVVGYPSQRLPSARPGLRMPWAGRRGSVLVLDRCDRRGTPPWSLQLATGPSPPDLRRIDALVRH